MVPVYAVTSFLSFWFYWHAIYYQVLSDCYEAFTIASFFALLCHYIAPNLHDQKEYFRGIQPRGWVWPLTWMRKCCCGDRGPWRTPRSGLTWFNIVWLGIYQYCFVMVAMTITSVVTQYFGRYCESSDSPVFAHIWVWNASLIYHSMLITPTGSYHRSHSSDDCHVLRDPILRPTAQGPPTSLAFAQSCCHKACYLSVLLANISDIHSNFDF